MGILMVYDAFGRVVQVLIDEVKLPRQYERKFDASKLDNGIYYCRLAADKLIQKKRCCCTDNKFHPLPPDSKSMEFHAS